MENALYFQKLKEVNQKRSIHTVAVVSIGILHLTLLAVILKFYTLNDLLVSKLLPMDYFETIFWEYVQKAMVLASGLGLVLILKLFKQNLLVILLVFLLVVYDIFGNNLTGDLNM